MKKPVLAASAIVRRGDSILLVKRASEPCRGKWALPGGRVEYGESLAHAVKREVAEEAGISIEPLCVSKIVEIVCPSEGYHFVIVVFYAEYRGGSVKLQREEVEDYAWLPPGDALGLDLTLSTRRVLEDMLPVLPELPHKPPVYSLSKELVSVLDLC